MSYTGTGYFLANLDHLTAANVIKDYGAKTVIIRIDHTYLRAIEIDPGQIIIEDEQESLLARENIKPRVADYTTIEQDLRSRLEEKFDIAANGGPRMPLPSKW